MRILIAAALLGAGEAPAEPSNPFCDDIRRIAGAAGDDPAFAGLAGANLFSLLEGRCTIPDPAYTSFFCHRTLAPRHVGAELLAGRIQACLPEARITRGAMWKSDFEVRHGRLEIDIDERGGERAHVGRIVTLYFRAAPAAP